MPHTIQQSRTPNPTGFFSEPNKKQILSLALRIITIAYVLDPESENMSEESRFTVPQSIENYFSNQLNSSTELTAKTSAIYKIFSLASDWKAIFKPWAFNLFNILKNAYEPLNFEILEIDNTTVSLWNLPSQPYQLYPAIRQLNVSQAEKKESPNKLPLPDSYLGEFLGIVTSVGEYVDVVSQVNRDQNKKNDKLWMRGICNRTYLNLPSVFREDEVWSTPIYNVMKNKLNKAYSSTLAEHDLWTNKFLGVKEHISALQHYGTHTNLLDFSPDPFIAIYFAITPDVKEDREKIEKGEFIPKVCFVNPERFMESMSFLEKQMSRATEFCTEPLSSFYATSIDYRYFPDCCNTVRLNELKTEVDLYTKDYCTQNTILNGMLPSNGCPASHNQPENGTNQSKSIRLDHCLLPTTFIARYSNSRIFRQKGTFIAYDLFTKGMRSADEERPDFNCFSLERLQQKVSELSKNSGNELKPFLYYVLISPWCIEEIRQSLKELGYEEKAVYPELNKILSSL